MANNQDVFFRGTKRDNARRYKGGGPRPDNNEHKQQEAKERDVHWASLAPADQIAALDRRLGKGTGAVKQRERIYARWAAADKAGAKPVQAATTAVATKEHVKAQDRRAAERAERPTK